MVAKKLILYTKTGCSWCVSARNYLHKHGYSFEEINVSENREAYDEMMRLSGQSYAPTLAAGGEVLPDFGTDELEAFLDQHDIRP